MIDTPLTEEEFNAQSKTEVAQRTKKESYLPDIHRLLPQSADAEQGVICSILLAPQEVGSMCFERSISKEHFHIPAHGDIYGVLMEMWASEKPIDLVTLTQELRKQKKLDAVGGAAFISQLFTFLPTAANATYYAEILHEKKTLREIVKVGTEFAGRAYEEQAEVTPLLDEFQVRTESIGGVQITPEPTMRENIMAATLHLELTSTGKGIVPVGLPAFDVDIGPLERGNLIVIGGQTKAAKSILATQLTLNAAMAGTPGLYVSLEMTHRELTMRMLAAMARVNTRQAKNWTPEESDRWAKAGGALDKLPVHITTGLYKLPQIIAKCQRASAASKRSLGVIVLDYAQLAEGTRKKDTRRQEEIAEISRTCKRLAVTLDVVFIILTQLNDEGRSRESRDIENDANLMIEVGHNKETNERLAKVVLSRSGPMGFVIRNLRFVAEHTRVEHCEPEPPPERVNMGKSKPRNGHFL